MLNGDAFGSHGTALDSATREYLWLLGQPSLSDFIDFARYKSLDGREIRRSDLIDDWRRANDHYRELEIAEPGIAETIDVRKLPGSAEPLAQAVMADHRAERSFDAVPTRIALVELDKIVVSQLHIDLLHHSRLMSRLRRRPSLKDLFAFCLPLAPELATVDVRRISSTRYAFQSESSDLRFIRAEVLSPSQVTHNEFEGRGGAVLGLAVGYSSNFLTAVEADGRIVLHNGYHRAYTLRAAGVKYAPCIIQSVTRRDELNLIAASTVTSSPQFFFKSPRPPILKDYFDPELRRTFKVPRTIRTVEISVEIKDFEVAVT